MMHLDAPWFDGSVRTALTELRDRCGVEALKDVELFDVVGIPLWLSGIGATALGVGLGSINENLLYESVAFLAWLCLFAGTRLRVRFLMWRLGFNQPTLLGRRNASGKPRHFWDFRVNVRVSTDGDGAFVPALTFPTHTGSSPRFLVVPPPSTRPPAATWWGRKRVRQLHDWAGWMRHLARAANSLQKDE